MNSVKKDKLAVEKGRISQRLKEIKEDRDAIANHVDSIFRKAEEVVTPLLAETSKRKFLAARNEVTRKLDDYWQGLFSLRSKIDGNTESGETSSDDSSAESELSEASAMSGATVLSEQKTTSKAQNGKKQSSEKVPNEDGSHPEGSGDGSHVIEEVQDLAPLCGKGDAIEMKLDQLDEAGGTNAEELLDTARTLVPSHLVDEQEYYSSSEALAESKAEAIPVAITQETVNEVSKVENCGTVVNELKNICAVPSAFRVETQTLPIATRSTNHTGSRMPPFKQTDAGIRLPTKKHIPEPKPPQMLKLGSIPSISKSNPVSLVKEDHAKNKTVNESTSSSNEASSNTSGTKAKEKLPSLNSVTQASIISPELVIIKPRELVIRSTVTAVLMNSTSLSDFWIQVDADKLTKLSDKLQVFCNSPKAESVGPELNKGDFVCAQFGDDLNWYRAMITKLHYSPDNTIVDTVDVLYVDYGNSETITLDRIKRLPAKYAKYAAHAVRCRLNNAPLNLDSATEIKVKEAIEKLDQAVLCNVVGLDSKSELKTYVVNMESDENGDVLEYLTKTVLAPDNSIVTKGAVKRLKSELMRRLEKTPQLRQPFSKIQDSVKSNDLEGTKKDRLDDWVQARFQAVSSDPKPETVSAAVKVEPAKLTNTVTGLKLQKQEVFMYTAKSGLTWNAVIRNLDLEKEPFYLIVAYIQSPSSFYAHVLPVGSRYQELMDKLKATYESEQNIPHPLPSAVQDGSCWAIKYSEDEEWYRVRVIAHERVVPSSSVRKKTISLNDAELSDRVHVHYVDYGNSEWVTVNRLRPLKKDLCDDYPALVAHFCLAHCYPPNTTGGELAKLPPEKWVWPDESYDHFCTEVPPDSDKILLGRVNDIDREPTSRFISDIKPLVLWEKENTKNINKAFVEAGFAISDKYRSGDAGNGTPTVENGKQTVKETIEDVVEETVNETGENFVEETIENVVEEAVKEIAEDFVEETGEYSADETVSLKENESSDQELEEWNRINPCEDHFNSEANTYALDPTEDAELVLCGYKAENQKQVCNFYKRGDCYKGDECPYEHVNLAPGDELLVTEEVPGDIPLTDFPEINTYVIVEVTSISTPGRFYVLMPHGPENNIDKVKNSSFVQHKENLKMLVAAMQKFYANPGKETRNPYVSFADGEIVAARFSNTEWLRGRVVNNDVDAGVVEIFSIDFGHIEQVSDSNVKILDSAFRVLPAQAVECFLANLEPVNDGSEEDESHSWSEEAKTWFAKLVSEKYLWASVVDIIGQTLVVELSDTTNPSADVHINNDMVERGFAKVRTTPFKKAKQVLAGNQVTSIHPG